MGGEWTTRKLVDLCDSVDYGYTASAKDTACGPKFLRITDIVSGSINWDTVPFCEIEDSARSRFLLRHGDVVIARTGATTGYSAYIANPPDAIFASYLVRLKVRRDTNACFIAYFLKSSRFWAYMRGVMGDKSAQPNASAKTMTQVTLPVPSLKEQQAIAYILGALDGKIELNRRMNRTLEDMARAIFKSWFVDFLPVRAKAECGQPRGLASHIADLFPDSFEDSGVGKIPKGWKAGSILKIADLLSGGTPTTSVEEYWNGDILWASAKDISQCGETFLIQTERKISELGLMKSSTKIIPAFSSVVVARGATTGRIAMFGTDIAMNQTCYALTSRNGMPFFLYCHFRHFVSALVFSAHGSVFDTITTRTFQTIDTIIPADNVRKSFDTLVKPLFLKVLGNQKESRHLSYLRDTLLPKLISGELRVPDAERIAGRCA